MRLSKSVIVAKYTFLEVYKSRIMINIVTSGFLLALMCYIASEFSYGNPSKVALDIGLGLLSITTKILALFFGANLLKAEIESRTIYLILSNPVTRIEFLVGKILGLSGILGLNTIILSIFTTGFYYFWEGAWTNLILFSIAQIFLESIIVLMLVTTFSLFTNLNLSIFYTIGLFLAGSSIANVMETSFIKNNKILSIIVKIIYFIIPNFSLFDIKDFILYQQEISTSYVLMTFGYGCLYTLMLLTLSSIVLSKKDLD